jgi:hypothetical protein
VTTVHVGFTGSREGATDEQTTFVEAVLRRLFQPDARFHFGDCVGQDFNAFVLADAIGYHTVAHPGDKNQHRAYAQANEVRAVTSNQTRNMALVDESQIIVAVPRFDEELRSGTWSTIRYARASKKVVLNWIDQQAAWTELDRWLARRITRNERNGE